MCVCVTTAQLGQSDELGPVLQPCVAVKHSASHHNNHHHTAPEHFTELNTFDSILELEGCNSLSLQHVYVKADLYFCKDACEGISVETQRRSLYINMVCRGLQRSQHAHLHEVDLIPSIVRPHIFYLHLSSSL